MSDIEDPRDPADAGTDDAVDLEGQDTVTGEDAERAIPTGVDDFDIDVTRADGPDLQAGDDLDTGAATS